MEDVAAGPWRPSSSVEEGESKGSRHRLGRRNFPHNFSRPINRPLSLLFSKRSFPPPSGPLTMSQRRGGLAESLLRMGSGGGGGVSGERAGRSGGGGDEPSEAAASSAAADVTANSTSTSATATAANIFNPTGTVSSNESTPRMQHAIVGSPFPFVLRQHSHHHKRHGEAHAPATTTTGFAAPPPPPVASSTLSAAASLEEPLLSGEFPHAAATAAAVPEVADLESGTRDGERRAAGAGTAGTGQQRQQQQPSTAAAATVMAATALATLAAATFLVGELF